MVTMAASVILNMSSPKCTPTHRKDHSCEVSLQSDQQIFFLKNTIPPPPPKDSIVNPQLFSSLKIDSKGLQCKISNLYAQLDT
jgi:hypothetical protein